MVLMGGCGSDAPDPTEASTQAVAQAPPEELPCVDIRHNPRIFHYGFPDGPMPEEEKLSLRGKGDVYGFVGRIETNTGFSVSDCFFMSGRNNCFRLHSPNGERVAPELQGLVAEVRATFMDEFNLCVDMRMVEPEERAIRTPEKAQ